MARKTLLTEAEIRQFMKLANIKPLQEMGGELPVPGMRDDEEDEPGMRDMREADRDDPGRRHDHHFHLRGGRHLLLPLRVRARVLPGWLREPLGVYADHRVPGYAHGDRRPQRHHAGG